MAFSELSQLNRDSWKQDRLVVDRWTRKVGSNFGHEWAPIANISSPLESYVKTISSLIMRQSFGTDPLIVLHANL